MDERALICVGDEAVSVRAAKTSFTSVSLVVHLLQVAAKLLDFVGGETSQRLVTLLAFLPVCKNLNE